MDAPGAAPAAWSEQANERKHANGKKGEELQTTAPYI